MESDKPTTVWEEIYERLMDERLLLSSLKVRDEWFLPRYKAWLLNLRLLSTRRRKTAIYSLYQIAKFAVYSIIFAAADISEVPGRLRKSYRFVLSRCDDFRGELITRLFTKTKSVDPLGVMYPIGLKNQAIKWSRVLPMRPETIRKYWRRRRLFVKRSVKRKLEKMRSKYFLKYVLVAPKFEVKRIGMATLYFSTESLVYYVMSNNALGRGRTVKDAVLDFIYRWRLLSDAELDSRLPAETYKTNLGLREAGEVYLVEFDNGEVKWNIKWKEEFERILDPHGTLKKEIETDEDYFDLVEKEGDTIEDESE